MRKKFGILLTTLAIIGAALMPQPALAASCDDGGFLGLKSWHAGLDKDPVEIQGTDRSTCVIRFPNDRGDGQDLARFVWTIAMNILADLFVVVGYAAIGFMIYGGWFLLSSEGDPNRVAKGKKILISAAIGAGIAILATVIVNTINAVLNAAT